MRKLALGALLNGVAVACLACGGGSTQLLDATSDGGLACNPMLQSGCMAGEKCTWVVDADTPTRFGHVACVANGSTPEGATCDVATAAGGGVDTCIAGTLCVAGKCKRICDPQLVSGSAAGACPTDYVCTRYAGVFQLAGEAVAGVCEPACDPLTQRLKVGTTNIDACGSADASQPSSTCINGSRFAVFSCAHSDSSLYGNTDRKPPLTDPTSGRYYPNGCAPGFIPFYFSESGSMITWCSGLCAPLKVDSSIAADMAHKDDNKGDAMALGKLVADSMPVKGHSICTPNVKGASDITAPRGEDCRFLWYPLAISNMGTPLQTPYNDTLGVCFAYEKFKFTPSAGGQQLTQKSCAELPPVSPSPTDPYGSAKDWGCYPLSQSRNASFRTADYRLGYENDVLVRHVLD